MLRVSSAILFVWLSSASIVQAGMFDIVSNAIGTIKDGIANGASPALPCETEAKAACQAFDLFHQQHPDWKQKTCAAPIPADAIKEANKYIGNIKAIAALRDKSQSVVNDGADAAKHDFQNYSVDEKPFFKATYAYHVCAAKAYSDAIEQLKGPDPATFKPVIPTVKVENLDKLPKIKKVILSNFVVEFQQRYEKRSSGFSFMGMGNAGSSTGIHDVTLPDQSTLQTITNFAYQDVIKKLKAKGYEVIEVPALSNNSKTIYGKMTQVAAAIKPGEVFSNIDGESVLMSPTGMTSLIPSSGCTHYGSRKAFANTANNFRIGPNAQTGYENQIANEEGKIPLLKVWVVVEFGDVDAKGGNAFVSARQRDFIGTTTTTTISNSANAEATTGMFLKPDVTRLSIEVPVDTQYKMNHGCGITFGNTLVPPADGDVFVRLAEAYHDDGDSAPLKMASHAGTVGVKDTYLGGGVGVRSVGENNDGSQQQTVDNGKGTQTTRKAAKSYGSVDTGGFGTSINTVNEWATNIRSDVYASSAATMIYKVTDAFISKLP
jgi:hypothetical protein